MTAVEIRVAGPDDFPAMHRIRMAVRENVLSDPARVQPSDYAAILDAGGRGWVAEADGRMVGFAVADLARANVWALFVDPGFEGRGVGRRLHDTMMDWFFDQGVDRVWLGTDPGTRAEGFYRSAGWRPAGEEPNGEVRFEISRTEWVARLTA